MGTTKLGLINVYYYVLILNVIFYIWKPSLSPANLNNSLATHLILWTNPGVVLSSSNQFCFWKDLLSCLTILESDGWGNFSPSIMCRNHSRSCSSHVRNQVTIRFLELRSQRSWTIIAGPWFTFWLHSYLLCIPFDFSHPASLPFFLSLILLCSNSSFDLVEGLFEGEQTAIY